MNIEDQMIQLVEEIMGNQQLRITQNRINEAPDPIAFDFIGKNVLEIDLNNTIYQYFDGVKFNWELAEAQDNTVGVQDNTVGVINIQTLDEIAIGYSGIVYFSEEDSMRNFHIIDFISDENCVGLFKGSKALYLYKFDKEPISLGISLDDYSCFLLASKGLQFWQYLLAEFNNSNKNLMSETFDNLMKPFFENVTVASIKELFESKRLNK